MDKVWSIYLNFGTQRVFAATGFATKEEATTAANAWRSSFQVGGWPIEIVEEPSGEQEADNDGDDDSVPGVMPSRMPNL